MGQSKWGWACALCAAAIAVTATRLTAAESEVDSFNHQKIEGALGVMLKSPIEASGIPLNQIIEQLSTDFDIPIMFDTAALDAAGTSPDTEVRINLRNVSLRSALELMLKGLELTYVIDDEVLLITTKDEADRRMEVRVYPVADLQASGPARATARGSEAGPATLGLIVARLVEHDTWTANGTGEGEIQEWPGMLIVSNTHTVHQKIEALLADMRGVIAKNEADNKANNSIGTSAEFGNAQIADASGATGDNPFEGSATYGGRGGGYGLGGYGGRGGYGDGGMGPGHGYGAESYGSRDSSDAYAPLDGNLRDDGGFGGGRATPPVTGDANPPEANESAAKGANPPAH